MRLLVLLSLFILSLNAQKVLVINSNVSIEKYKNVQSSFSENFKYPFDFIDISKMNKKEIKEYLYDEYPDVVYAIGAKAYQYTNLYIPEKTIFFSSIINYKRLNLTRNRNGVSNELYSGMNLTIIKSLFPKTKKLSVIYSEYTKDLYESFKQSAKNVNIEILAHKIDKKSMVKISELKKSDGLILVADPLLLKNEKEVKKLFKQMKEIKKPIFSYDRVFINFGATLAISAHNPTIGNQIALMMTSYLKNEEYKNIQIPIGTNVIFNKKIADEFGFEYNHSALSVVNEVIQ